MKRGVIALIIMAVFLVTKVAGQNPNIDRLNAYKIAFFTKRLNLTPKEAERFWPVYNEFQNKRNAIQMERQQFNKLIAQYDLNMTEKQMIEAGDQLISTQVKEASLAEEYHKNA